MTKNISNSWGISLTYFPSNWPCSYCPNGDTTCASAEDACDYILRRGVFSTLERQISAACAIEAASGFLLAHKDVGD